MPRILLTLQVKAGVAIDSDRPSSSSPITTAGTISYQCSEVTLSGCAMFARRSERPLSSMADHCQSRSLKFLQRSGRTSLKLGARSPPAVGTTCQFDTTRLCPRLRPSRRTTQSFELTRPDGLSVKIRHRRARETPSLKEWGSGSRRSLASQIRVAEMAPFGAELPVLQAPRSGKCCPDPSGHYPARPPCHRRRRVRRITPVPE